MKGNAHLISVLGITVATVTPSATTAQTVGDTVQERIAWLRDHVVPLRSVDPADTDFSDLRPIANALQDARVVLLGEQTHADGATFATKARLIEFLHRDAGFDVLAFETNQEAARLLDAELSGDLPISAVSGLALLWSENASVRALLTYARDTRARDRPLHTAGFDIQLNTPGGQRIRALYRRVLRDRLTLAPLLQSSDGVERVDSILGALFETDLTDVRHTDYEFMLDAVARLRARAAAVTAGDTAIAAARLVRFLDNLTWGLKFADQSAHGPSRPWTVVRDAAMGENLVWLADREFPGRRIVAWGHWGHFAKNLEAIEVLDGSASYVGERPMGQHVADALGAEAYSVGFLAFGGEYGTILPDTAFIVTVPEPPVGSLDWLLGQLGEPYLFLDLRSVPQGHWLRQELVARPGYLNMRAVWPIVFDGIIFIHEMFPNDRRPAGREE